MNATRRLPVCRKFWVALLTAKSTAELRGMYRSIRAFAARAGGESSEAFDAAVLALMTDRAHNLGGERLGTGVCYVYAAYVHADACLRGEAGLWTEQYDAGRRQLAAAVFAGRRAVA